jgi:hypothetical protein
MLLKSVSTKVIRCYPMENNVIFIFEIRKRSLFIGGGGGGGGGGGHRREKGWVYKILCE